MNNKLTWTITTERHGEDIILSLPDDLLKSQDWAEGDVIVWIDNEDGTWTLRKSSDS